VATVDNVTKIVTTTQSLTAETGNSGITWAIGGSLATLNSTNSVKLVANGAGADMQPGWAIEFQSGHTEAPAATITIQKNGTSAGNVSIGGKVGAAVMPIITFSNNNTGFATQATSVGVVFHDFEMKNSSGTKTLATAFGIGTTSTMKLRNVKVRDATNNFNKAVVGTAAGAVYCESCEFAHCASNAFDATSATAAPNKLIHCYIHDNTGKGVNSACADIEDCRITGNTGDGVTMIGTGTATTFTRAPRIVSNTITSNGGDGVQITSTSAQTAILTGMQIENNIITGNTGYGLDFSGASITALLLSTYYVTIQNNALSGNSGASNSGKYNVDLSTIDGATSAQRGEGSVSGSRSTIIILDQ
jgi:hypothetical protein